MDAVGDYEDILALLAKHKVRYLIIGGLAFLYHAKPRYTRDMDLWVEAAPPNIDRANAALAEFGSPGLLNVRHPEEVLQIGVEPVRIDIFLRIEGARFPAAWKKRIRGRYGDAPANWVDIDTLIRIKSRIDDPRHQEDVRILREVKRRRAQRSPRRGDRPR
jgi:hypothetical protein